MVVRSLKDLEGSGGDGDDAGAGGGHMAPPIDGEKMSKYFAGIYHEKQVGSLCAVHAVNNLLQGPVLSEVDLAQIGHGIDAEERRALGGGSIEAESGNVRADGFFSVQVIAVALQRLGLTLTPIGSESARDAAARPAAERGYICNRSQHWFSIRKLGGNFFDLNSMKASPVVLGDFEVVETLAKAKDSGYSVFVVRGAYPPAPIEGDQGRLRAAVDACRRAHGDGFTMSGGPGAGAAAAPPAFDAFSGAGQTLAGGGGAQAGVQDEIARVAESDPELAAALAASLQDAPGAGPAGAAAPKTAAEEAEEMRRKRLARFG